MKALLLALAGVLLATATVLASPAERRLVGDKQCTWGPSFWCSNLRNAKGCGAVTHCIQTVWEKQKYPVDNDEICNICLDMVKQARDQLESNETQADLKAVFEGSCNLIPIKVVKKECRKLADDFIPELVEALASQMNPNVVCSVAGLCNNAAIDNMLEEMPAVKPKDQDDLDDSDETEKAVSVEQADEFSCGKCNKIAGLISDRFHASDRDQVLEGFLRFCGRMGSFSDGCSSIVLTYFSEIYDHLEKELTGKNVCHMTGACAALYHQHEEKSSEEIEIRPMGGVGVIKVDGEDQQQLGDDIPCKLCEQLVDHLRDVLIANTTELEFKQVLEGLCKQTKSFSSECLSLVDQYYEEIYSTLVHNLNSNDACFMIGVCPKGLGAARLDGPVMPIVPLKVAVMVGQNKPPRKLLGENEPKLSAVEIQQAQLPIDRLMGAPVSLHLVENGGFCTLCEYFMHFVQEALSEPGNEDEIKNVVGTTCEKLPKAIRGECHTFVDLYGDAVIALLIQSMDPRQVCPELRMCPASNDQIEVFAPAQIDVTIDANAGQDKPTCPLCLFAVSQLEESIKNDRTKENVKQALDKLCSHLSSKLKLECTDFVETYSAELIEMLVSDFTPQEICVYLKLCVDQRPDLSLLNMEFDRDNRQQNRQPQYDIETNEISDITVNGQIAVDHQATVSSPECLVCEEMVKEVEKRIQNKKSKEQIKEALEHACDRLRKYKTKCERYIDQHADQIVDLLMKQLSPKEICHTLGFCIAKEVDELEVDEALLDYVVEPAVAEPPKELFSPVDVPASVTGGETNQPPQCAICEFVMVKLESELADKKTEKDIEDAVRNVCSKLPNTVTKQCDHLIDQYGTFIIKFLATLPPKQICTRLALCQQQLQRLEESSLEIIECAVCQGAMKTVDEILGNKKVDYDIVQDVEKICNTVPARYYEKCVKMVQVYGISMVRQLENYVEREQVCVNMGMCSSPSGYVRFEDEVSQVDHAEKKHAYQVGAKECTWGPAHWCSSEENAQKCNASKFCSEKKLGKWQE